MTSDRVSDATPAGRKVLHCPDCGAAVIDKRATWCWLCEAPLSGRSGIEAAGREESRPLRLPERRDTGIGFALVGTVMLLWSLGLAIEAPGVLVVVLIVLTPVLIRTAMIVSAQKARGESPSAGPVIVQILSSVGVVALVGLASIAAFFGAFFAICLGGAAVSKNNAEWALIPALASGVVAAIFVLVALILWVRRRRVDA
jgi:hypothetical protein